MEPPTNPARFRPQRRECHTPPHGPAGGLGNLDQQPFLAVDPLDLLGERLEHPLPGLAADFVDDLDHKIDQPIREFTLPMREEQRIKSMTPVVRMPAHGPRGFVEHAAPEHPCNGAAQIRTCGNRQRQTLHEGEPPGCEEDVVEVGLARIGFQIREAGRAILVSKRSVKPATMLGRQRQGDRIQHLVLEHAAGGDDQRAQRFLAGSCDPVLDEPAEEALHHPQCRQSQGAQFGPGPGGCIPHVLLPRPAETQVGQDLGAVAASGAAKPVVVRQIRNRCPDLLG